MIIVDDCSSDNSLSVAKTFKDNRITVLSTKKNSGYSVAKNHGIRKSKGKFITCLDADDMFTKNSLSLRLSVFDKDKTVEFVDGRAIDVFNDVSLEQCYLIDLDKAKRAICIIHAQGVMVRRSIYQRFGLYDENLKSRADKEMWWRLFGRGCAGLHLVKRVRLKDDVAYYRLHKNSMMKFRQKNKKYNNKVTNLLEKAYQNRTQNGINKDNTTFLET